MYNVVQCCNFYNCYVFVCVYLYHAVILFIPIESSIELYTHNTPVCLTCIHMTHLFALLAYT